MNFLQLFVWVLLVLTVAGLYKPWWVLWWMSKQNRKKVLLIYGIPFVVACALYLFFK